MKMNKSKEEKKPRADELLHAKDGDVDIEAPNELVIQFKAKINKYGFLHIPKKGWSSLPFGIEQPLTARIEGETLVIAATTKKST
jgi:hypothetical protein